MCRSGRAASQSLRSSHRRNEIFVIFDIVIALTMMLAGSYGLYEMAALPKPRGDGIGPAFYPAILSAVLLCLASILLVKSFVSIHRDGVKGAPLSIRIRTYGRPLVLLLSTLIYTLLLNKIGFPLLTVILVSALAYMLDPCALHRKLVFSLAFTAAAWAVFKSFLGLPLPLGVLRFIL